MPQPRRRSRRRPAVMALAALCALVHGGLRADELGELKALLAQGQAEQALPRAERAAAAEPRDVQMRFLLGVVLMDLRRDGDALQHFVRMSQDYPELPDPYNNIALLHARAGRLEPARQALEMALRNDPSHRVARTNLGQVHLMLAAQAWETVAADGIVDGALQRRLDAVRALLASTAAAAR